MAKTSKSIFVFRLAFRGFADMSKEIQQVLYNIIDNAIEFNHNDSAITIETTSPRYGKDFVSRRDTGIGIPRRTALEKIWERFYKRQICPAGKIKKGTGLGLAIVKKSFSCMEKISTWSAPKVSARNLSFLSAKQRKRDGES